MPDPMRRVRAAEHRILHRDPHGYCAHPHLVACGGELLVVFNWAPRRPFVLHPPQEPLFHNLLTRSRDQGRSWSAPVVVPDYGWSGVECAGLTDLGGGALLLNQWRFRWHPLPAAERLADRSGIAFPDELAAGLAASPDLDWSGTAAHLPWARGPGRAFVHHSADGGRSWSVPVELATAPYVGGYGMRGGVVLADGTILLPLCDVPRYAAVFVLRSTDGGRSWSPPRAVATADGRLFEEPAPLRLPSGRVLLLLREDRSRSLWSTWSDDAGVTWAPPRPTGIAGYPAHLCRLADGRTLCTYGVRTGPAPFAVRACLSVDEGESWETASALAIRDDLPDRDLGYPCTLPLAHDTCLTVYYGRDATATTCIQATRWRLED